MNDTAYKISVMSAFLEGKEIQAQEKDKDYGWETIFGEPSWDFARSHYRIKPRKKLDIPWNLIKPEYKWAAMDRDGWIHVYAVRPETQEEWWISKYDSINIGALAIDTDGVQWQDSLTQRPE